MAKDPRQAVRLWLRQTFDIDVKRGELHKQSKSAGADILVRTLYSVRRKKKTHWFRFDPWE